MISRRRAPVVLLAGIALGLAACAPALPETPAAPPAAPPVSTQPAEPGQGAEPEQTAMPAAAADELCAESSQAGEGDICVLEAIAATDTLEFTGYRVVKLIGGSFAGAVSISGVEQITIAEATFDADLTLDASGGAVVKMSQIGGSLFINGGHSATLVKNAIGGDLLCASGVEANGSRNDVGGDVTGTCTRVS